MGNCSPAQIISSITTFLRHSRNPQHYEVCRSCPYCLHHRGLRRARIWIRTWLRPCWLRIRTSSWLWIWSRSCLRLWSCLWIRTPLCLCWTPLRQDLLNPLLSPLLLLNLDTVTVMLMVTDTDTDMVTVMLTDTDTPMLDTITAKGLLKPSPLTVTVMLLLMPT